MRSGRSSTRKARSGRVRTRRITSPAIVTAITPTDSRDASLNHSRWHVFSVVHETPSGFPQVRDCSLVRLRRCRSCEHSYPATQVEALQSCGLCPGRLFRRVHADPDPLGFPYRLRLAALRDHGTQCRSNGLSCLASLCPLRSVSQDILCPGWGLMLRRLGVCSVHAPAQCFCPRPHRLGPGRGQQHPSPTSAKSGRSAPAMEAGLSDHVWSLEERVALMPEPAVAPWGSRLASLKIAGNSK